MSDRENASDCEGLMRHTTTILTVLVIALLILSGCTGWYSRYFERTEKSLRCTGQYCFSPRIVSYKDEFGEPDTFGEHGYWVSIKVYDTSVVQPKDIRKEDQKSVRGDMADLFQDRLVRLFRFDSLVLRLKPQDTSLLVQPDTSRYTPRDIDYLSYNFGKVIIPEETDSLSAVFYYRILDQSAALPTPDSVLFDMIRFEEKNVTSISQLVGKSPEADDQGEEEKDEDK